MKIKIITDCTADLSNEQAKKYNVEVLPVEVRFGDKMYLPNVNLSTKEFYDMLRKAEQLPQTSQINEFTWKEQLEKICVDSDTQYLVMPVSKELSGTFNSCKLALEQLGRDNIHLVDTNNVTFGLGAIIIETAKCAGDIDTIEELLAKISELCDKCILLAYVGDLKYLKKGGRLSGTQAVLANMFNIKPVVSIVKGKVNVVYKALGINKACDYIVKTTNDLRDQSYPLYLGEADCDDDFSAFIAKYSASLGLTGEEETVQIGPTVGTHVGPMAVGIVCFRK